MRKGLLMILTAAMLTLAPMSASAAVRGFVVVGRPYYGGWYAPYWGPYWGPSYYGGYYYGHPNAGEVKLDMLERGSPYGDDERRVVALTVGDVPDVPGQWSWNNPFTQYAQKVYVVAGKTLHLHPEL